MKSFSDIVEEIKSIISSEFINKKIFDKDVALALDIAHGTFRQQKHKSTTIPYSEVMQFLARRNISINFKKLFRNIYFLLIFYLCYCF